MYSHCLTDDSYKRSIHSWIPYNYATKLFGILQVTWKAIIWKNFRSYQCAVFKKNWCFSLCPCRYMSHITCLILCQMVWGSEFGNRIASQKDPSIVRKIVCCRLKHFSVLWNILVYLQREFMKHVILISLVLWLLLLLFFFNSKIHIFTFSLQ